MLINQSALNDMPAILLLSRCATFLETFYLKYFIVHVEKILRNSTVTRGKSTDRHNKFCVKFGTSVNRNYGL